MRALSRAGFAAALCVTLGATAHATVDFGQPVSPPGITVEPALRGFQMQGGVPLNVTPGYFTDSEGLTLYSFAGDKEPGKSACADDCASTWPALTASANAVSVGDWSVVMRPDGARQWAFQGRPLYRSVKDTKPGDKNGQGAGEGAWQVATVDTAKVSAIPGSVAVRSVANAIGDVFVDYRGMTLYVFDGDAEPGKSACAEACAKIWPPLLAGGLSKAIGDWNIVSRSDGTRQWAYRGQPLYGFSGDGKPGDAKGLVADAHWKAAAVKRYFLPPEVRPRINGNMTILATAQGMTLYARDKYRYSSGGYSVNDGPPPTPAVGRAIGPGGCTGACTDSWKPLAAASDALPTGYWTIAQRDDGIRQWVYQGYPVYTYVKDTKPGDMAGRDLFDLTDGANALYWRPVTP